MLDILESFVQQRSYKYLRMDGTTNINSRQPLIQQFNTDISIYVFLLTTRVGGLGVNLTGADRVIIYDPDWNPSTDTQARERAWRIGQRKDVTIYRLLTSGTIEEKIYHRQIFKQYLTNRVLKDPKQRRFFKSNDLYELFTLKEAGTNGTETEAIFAGTDASVETEKRTEVTADKSENEEWMKRWKKEREVREKLWRKELEKQKKKADNKKSDKKDKKRDKKEKKKQVHVDGCEVNFIVKKSAFQPSVPDPSEQEAATSSSQDDYVLKKLFAKSGVLSALRHDSIVNPGDPDYVLVEGEAERVAKQAVQELKHSRRQCWNAQSGIPSWTGQSGTMRTDNVVKPRFGQKKKTILEQPSGGSTSTVGCSVAESSAKVIAQEVEPIPSGSNLSLSSGDLLKRMRSRNQLLGVPNTDNNEDGHLQSAEREEELINHSEPIPLEFADGVNYREMIDDIRSFVAFRGVVPGQVTTEDIVNEFNNNLPERSAALFRGLLKQLCNFTRNSQGQGIWQLKPEFI